MLSDINEARSVCENSISYIVKKLCLIYRYTILSIMGQYLLQVRHLIRITIAQLFAGCDMVYEENASVGEW